MTGSAGLVGVHTHAWRLHSCPHPHKYTTAYCRYWLPTLYSPAKTRQAWCIWIAHSSTQSHQTWCLLGLATSLRQPGRNTQSLILIWTGFTGFIQPHKNTQADTGLVSGSPTKHSQPALVWTEIWCSFN